MERIRNILRYGSPSFRKSPEGKILGIWLDVTGRKEETITKKEWIELIFLVNGFMGAFEELNFPEDLPILEKIANDALGKGYFGTLQGVTHAK